MNANIPNEIWQVEVGGQIYEAPLAELPTWIDEGSLQPADMVRKGNLRWIEARKVPVLIPFFNAREKGEPMPVVQTMTDAAGVPLQPEAISMPVPGPAIAAANTLIGLVESPVAVAAETVKMQSVPGQCVRHHDRPGIYICAGCSLEFCKACPSSYGGSVRICPECGSLCRTAADDAKLTQQKAAGLGLESGSFGFGDFRSALAHPFNFKASLIFGGIMFTLFSVGQSAASIGGITLISAALICMLLANMLVFGVRANVIDNFTQGRLDADFMPSFDDFSIWGDVVHPFLLSIGVYISSFGPFFLTAVIGAYLVFSAAGEQMKKYNEELTSVPGTQFYAPDRTAEQSREVRELLDQVKRSGSQRSVEEVQRPIAPANNTAVPAADVPPTSDQEKEKLDKLLQEIRTRQLEQEAPAPDPSGRYAAVISSIMHLAAPLVVAGMLTFLWGAFYYPAACAVAGYTRSFAATVNPLVGLDTIRHLGLDYLKILLMGFVLIVIAGALGLVLEIVLSPFTLPRVGNLPATVLGSIASFYFSVVFSCILGLALFRSADRLRLSR